jgi:diguanylate cyclase (GGDEF)-like protein
MRLGESTAGRGRKFTITTRDDMTDLLLPRHLDIFQNHLDKSEIFLMVRYAADHTISAASKAFISQIPDEKSLLGESVDRYLADPDGRDCSLLSSSIDELPVSFTVTIRPTQRTYLCTLYADDTGYVLLGDLIAESKDEAVQRMSLMTNELASLTLELRKRNADLEQANETIRELTRVDPLTELANRRYFAEVLDTALTFAHRHEQPLSLISIDLDRFKFINDTYGHDVGDEVLKNFANILRESCRNEDFPVRLGGEEFLILLPNTVVDEAFTLADRLREKLTSTDMGQGHSITASFGVTQLLENDNYFNFMKRADMALYEAKSGGRNKTVVRMTNNPQL